MRFIDLEGTEGAIIEQVAAIEKENFPDPWAAGEIAKTIAQKSFFCTVLTEGENVLGYYLCCCVLDECEIIRIAVRKELHHQGMGRKMMCQMEETCQLLGVKKMLLDVRVSNLAAVSYYKKSGFHEDGVRKNFYGGTCPEDALLMSRMLEAGAL